MSHNPSHSFPSDDGISVVELEPSPDPTVFAGVLDAYQEQGYEHGYQRALVDMRISLLGLSEDYLRGLPYSNPEVRDALRGFEAYVQQYFRSRERIELLSDGLGI